MNVKLGAFLSVMSSVVAGLMYFYATLLKPMAGTEIFGWRMVLIFPFITIVLIASGSWPQVRSIITRAQREPALCLGLVATSILIGIQQWLFLWAPLNNAALEVSLGYFLLPLVMVLAGLVVYREKLSLFQTLAVCSAAIGVAHEFWRMGSLSWETAVVAFGMPAYFILRRALGTSNLGGFWFDVMLMFPAAVLVIVTASNPLVYFATTPKLLYLLPGLAILSALAFASFILASWYLPLSIFGLLGYLEPVLLFLVALAIGEALRPSDLFTYVPVILAVGILSLEGARHLIRQNESNIERKDARLDEVRE